SPGTTTASSSFASRRTTSARSSARRDAPRSRCGPSSRPYRPSSGGEPTSTSSTRPRGRRRTGLMLAPDAWVPLAEVMRPHGVQGELRLRLFNKDSDLLLGLDEVLVRFPEGD